MKKLIFTILCFSIFEIVGAQEQFFVRSGIGLSNAKFSFGDEPTHANPALLVSISAGIDFKINKKFFVQSSLGFSKKGYRFIVHNFFEEGIIYPKMDLNYLHFDLMMKSKIEFFDKRERKVRSKKSQFFFLTGLQTSKLIFSKWHYHSSAETNSDGFFKPLDLGVVLGFSFDRKINTMQRIGVDFRYTHGFYDIREGGYETYLRGIETGFSYFFGLKNKKKN